MFLLGGQGYCTIEILWRGRTHYSILLAGGIILMFLAFIQKNEKGTSVAEVPYGNRFHNRR